MLSSALEIHSSRFSTIAQILEGRSMDRRDRKVEELDPRALIRLNSLIELKYFVMALLYQHKNGNQNDEET